MTDVPAEWTWPFSRSELMAGLRRYLAASSLRLLDIKVMPLPTSMPGMSSLAESGSRLSAMAVGVRIEGDDFDLPLLLKEPPVSRSGHVLRAIGQREYGVYRRLAPNLPLLVPGLVAGDEVEGWLIQEVLTGLRPATEWTVEDYEEALLNLVTMHDRFWGLSDVLVTYPWLARPLGADFDETVDAAEDAVQTLRQEASRPQIEPYLALFDRLIQSAEAIAYPLRLETATLTHGDYWPGNIARPIDGRQIVFDWQLAGIGPAIIDLVSCVQSTRLRLEPAMPVERMIDCYRERAAQLFEPGWGDEAFDRLWDHTLLWLFLARWLGRLATLPAEEYVPMHQRFRAVWLEPVAEAAARRLTES
ncbi:MAG: aminoglycoside phosphotransferase family protein [Anaerolineae bacterium]|nr:aminoglycoside phosphotransferase family protein [Anaerolineae bacterium]